MIFFVDDNNNNDRTDYVTPCVYARGNKRKADIDQRVTKEVKPIGIKEVSNSTKFNKVLITMIMKLLLLTLTSIVLSVTTFSGLTSGQFKLVRQLDKSKYNNSDINLTAYSDSEKHIPDPYLAR